MSLEIKIALLEACQEWVDKRHQTILKSIAGIKTSLLEESKSSAGDKHETGRAMLQIEREKAGEQLREVEKVKRALNRINIKGFSEHVKTGSLVITSVATYFISVPVGAIKLDETTYFVVSPESPIGKLLLGRQKGDEIVFRNSKSVIVEVQ